MPGEIAIPIDVNCLYSIVVKNGNQNKIIEMLQLSEPKVVTWEEAIKVTRDRPKEYLNYEHAIISENINGWVFIICERFYTQSYAMNCCNILSKEFNEIYYFLTDDHIGIYKFIKIMEGQIVRFFERDYNHNTGEFGELIQEEKDLKKENKEHSFSHVVEVADRILEFNTKLLNSN